MNQAKPLIAIRSLRSEHHANNIEPKVINVNWFLGKRCNYDCSYCSPTIHDWVSPHLKLNNIIDFVQQINDWALTQGKSFNMSLTGGEPFVHPEIIDILKIIRKASHYGTHLSATTNGSLPLDLYNHSLEFVTHLTISLHLERSDDETKSTLEKAIALTKAWPDKWINVQVMCLPGKLDFIDQQVIPLLESNQVKFTLRRIRPWLNEAVPEWQPLDKRNILKSVYTIEQQTQMKEAEKQTLDLRLTEVYQSNSYYTADELDWFKNRVPATTWQNIGCWDENKFYYEINSDIMVSNNHNQFLGWTCFAGVDSLYIDFDGQVYRGVCHNDGPLGKLGNKIEFPNTPTVCTKQWCTSNVDQTVRKAKSDSINLITNG